MKIFILLNFRKWSYYKFSNAFNRCWILERHYKNGHRWTPFVFLKVRKFKTKDFI